MNPYCGVSLNFHKFKVGYGDRIVYARLCTQVDNDKPFYVAWQNLTAFRGDSSLVYQLTIDGIYVDHRLFVTHVKNAATCCIECDHRLGLC